MRVWKTEVKTGDAAVPSRRPQLVDADLDDVTARVVGHVVVTVIQTEFQRRTRRGRKLNVRSTLDQLRADPKDERVIFEARKRKRCSRDGTRLAVCIVNAPCREAAEIYSP